MRIKRGWRRTERGTLWRGGRGWWDLEDENVRGEYESGY